MNAEELMREAIGLALRGRGLVEPNPRVGALALQGGQVVGRGWHARYGGKHAEVAAIEDAASRTAKVDCVVVTLEPCSSELGTNGKKTPPCTKRLLAAGVRQVIFGAEDPDPRHAGQARKVLEGAGLEVRGGVLADDCAEMNQPFRRWLSLDRPWTIAKYAMSLDGKTATRSGESRWISGEDSRARGHAMRASVDGVVVGFRTAEIDDPELSLRLAEGVQPLRILIDPLLELETGKKLIAQAAEIPSLIIHRDSVPAERSKLLAAKQVQLLPIAGIGDRGLDLPAAWRELRRRGLRRIMVEGGGGLIDQLCRADCLDQLLVFIAPRLIGSSQAPSPMAGLGYAQLEGAPRLSEMHWQECGDDLALGAFFLDSL